MFGELRSSDSLKQGCFCKYAYISYEEAYDGLLQAMCTM